MYNVAMSGITTLAKIKCGVGFCRDLRARFVQAENSGSVTKKHNDHCRRCHAERNVLILNVMRFLEWP